jgi:hypothetical protein
MEIEEDMVTFSRPKQEEKKDQGSSFRELLKIQSRQGRMLSAQHGSAGKSSKPRNAVPSGTIASVEKPIFRGSLYPCYDTARFLPAFFALPSARAVGKLLVSCAARDGHG